MTKTLIIQSGQKPTEEQLKEVEDAKRSPINFDEDCEELSPAMMKAFKSAVVQRNRKKFVTRGVAQVLVPALSSGMDAAISGIAGIGHILMGVSLVLLLLQIKRSV